MEIISNSLLWILPAFLSIGFIKNGWLNQRAETVGKAVERISWASFWVLAIAYLAWGNWGTEAMVRTVTDAGLIGFRLDALSGIMALLVTFLGGIILRFSQNYLAGDKRQGYFFKWMMLTLGSVLALVLSPGLVQFTLAWMATSLSLHKLIIYYPERSGTQLSARKKFAISRVGDLLVGSAFIGVYMTFGAQDFSAIFQLLQSGDVAEYSLPGWVAWFLVLGAIFKSAQFPFHTWLPYTLGAPTPVSALMHAGVINAGGYLIVRMSPVLTSTEGALSLLAISGLVTVVLASLVMITQTSIKQTLAFSTIAQMGFMLLQCGLGAFYLAILHLVAHSLYKAYNFLSSGESVSTCKQLAGEEDTSGISFGRFIFSFGLAGVILLLLTTLLPLNLENKPGMIVLSSVLLAAMMQVVWQGIRIKLNLTTVAKSAGKAAAFGGLYFGLSILFSALLQGILPHSHVSGKVFEWGLAVVLFLFMTGSLLLQETTFKLREGDWAKALYVHSLNGFYLNTLANRFVRALRYS